MIKHRSYGILQLHGFLRHLIGMSTNLISVYRGPPAWDLSMTWVSTWSSDLTMSPIGRAQDVSLHCLIRLSTGLWDGQARLLQPPLVHPISLHLSLSLSSPPLFGTLQPDILLTLGLLCTKPISISIYLCRGFCSAVRCHFAAYYTDFPAMNDPPSHRALCQSPRLVALDKLMHSSSYIGSASRADEVYLHNA